MEQAMVDALLEHQLDDDDFLVGDDEWCIECPMLSCVECEIDVEFPTRDEVPTC